MAGLNATVAGTAAAARNTWSARVSGWNSGRGANRPSRRLASSTRSARKCRNARASSHHAITYHHTCRSTIWCTWITRRRTSPCEPRHQRQRLVGREPERPPERTPAAEDEAARGVRDAQAREPRPVPLAQAGQRVEVVADRGPRHPEVARRRGVRDRRAGVTL